MKKLLAIATLATVLSGTMASAEALKWTGVVAVKESVKVWEIYDAAAGDLEQFVENLEIALDTGEVEPATGEFYFSPFDAVGNQIEKCGKGEPCWVDLQPQHNGTWYLQGPASFFQPDYAMCVTKVGGEFIATQKRFPMQMGPATNCINFDEQALSASFADTNFNAATIVYVDPAG